MKKLIDMIGKYDNNELFFGFYKNGDGWNVEFDGLQFCEKENAIIACKELNYILHNALKNENNGICPKCGCNKLYENADGSLDCLNINCDWDNHT